MKESAFKAYLKSIFLVKVRWQITFLFLFLTYQVVLTIFMLKGFLAVRLTNLLNGGGLVIYLVIIGIDFFLSGYRFYKKYDYKIATLPETVAPEDSEFDVKMKLIELEKRIQDLEKITPLKLAVYAIFIGIALSIALTLINRLLTH